MVSYFGGQKVGSYGGGGWRRTCKSTEKHFARGRGHLNPGQSLGRGEENVLLHVARCNLHKQLKRKGQRSHHCRMKRPTTNHERQKHTGRSQGQHELQPERVHKSAVLSLTLDVVLRKLSNDRWPGSGTSLLACPALPLACKC